MPTLVESDTEVGVHDRDRRDANRYQGIALVEVQKGLTLRQDLAAKSGGLSVRLCHAECCEAAFRRSTCSRRKPPCQCLRVTIVGVERDAIRHSLPRCLNIVTQQQ
jgi:hypothetical protein